MKSIKKKAAHLEELDVPFLFVYLDRGFVLKGATSRVSEIFKTETYKAFESDFTDFASNQTEEEEHDVTEEDLNKVRRIQNYLL